MKHHNRQGYLLFHLSNFAEMCFYTLVCICLVDIYYPTYFQINLAFIRFILLLQVSLNVLQYLNHYEAL